MALGLVHTPSRERVQVAVIDRPWEGLRTGSVLVLRWE